MCPRTAPSFFKDAWRRPAAGGYPNRLWARTRTLVAAAAVAGLALLGPRITAANTGVCSVGTRARSLALSEGVAFHR
jgi:hypothetical protein